MKLIGCATGLLLIPVRPMVDLGMFLSNPGYLRASHVYGRASPSTSETCEYASGLPLNTSKTCESVGYVSGLPQDTSKTFERVGYAARLPQRPVVEPGTLQGSPGFL